MGIYLVNYLGYINVNLCLLFGCVNIYVIYNTRLERNFSLLSFRSFSVMLLLVCAYPDILVLFEFHKQYVRHTTGLQISTNKWICRNSECVGMLLLMLTILYLEAEKLTTKSFSFSDCFGKVIGSFKRRAVRYCLW